MRECPSFWLALLLVAGLGFPGHAKDLEEYGDCQGDSPLRWAINCVNNALGDPAGKAEDMRTEIKTRLDSGIERVKSAARDAYYDAFGEAGRNVKEVDAVLTEGRSGNIAIRGTDLIREGMSGDISPQEYERRVDSFGRDVLYDGGQALENMHPRKFGVVTEVRETVEGVRGKIDQGREFYGRAEGYAKDAYDWMKDDGTVDAPAGAEGVRNSYERSMQEYAGYAAGTDPDTFVGEDPGYLKNEVFGQEDTHRQYEYEAMEEAYYENGYTEENLYVEDGQGYDPNYEDKSVYDDGALTDSNTEWIESEAGVFQCAEEFCDQADTPWMEVEEGYLYECTDDGRCSATKTEEPTEYDNEPLGSNDDSVRGPASPGSPGLSGSGDLGRELAGLVGESLGAAEKESQRFNDMLDSQFDIGASLERAAREFEQGKAEAHANALEQFNAALQGFAAGMALAAQAMQQQPAGGQYNSRSGHDYGGGQGLGGECTPLPPACQSASDQAMSQIRQLQHQAGAGVCRAAQVAVQVYDVQIRANQVCANSYPAGPCRQAVEAQLRHARANRSQSQQSARAACGG